jgi:hypothetical protein
VTLHHVVSIIGASDSEEPAAPFFTFKENNIIALLKAEEF